MIELEVINGIAMTIGFFGGFIGLVDVAVNENRKQSARSSWLIVMCFFLFLTGLLNLVG